HSETLKKLAPKTQSDFENIHKSFTENNANQKSSKSATKYGLRPRTISTKRLFQESHPVDPPSPKKARRSKSRSLPLSKYRRKTANSRERDRMKEINMAFESLRKILPVEMELVTGKSCSTKITTLRLAVSYIQALSHVLEEGSNLDSHKMIKQESDSTNKMSKVDVKQEHVQQYILQSLLTNGKEFHDTYKIQNALQGTFLLSTTPTNIIKSEENNNNLHNKFQNYDTPHLIQKQYQINQMNPSLLSNQMITSSYQASRSGSLSSSGELEDLLAEDTDITDDNLDVFQNFTMCVDSDPLDLLFYNEDGVDKSNQCFTTQFCR
ncbi:unnamed protein product, partial [Meganyctiphanes norvegica]